MLNQANTPKGAAGRRAATRDRAARPIRVRVNIECSARLPHEVVDKPRHSQEAPRKLSERPEIPPPRLAHSAAHSFAEKATSGLSSAR
eukprot:5522745-Alexandrium_andersonii.AAC.1